MSTARSTLEKLSSDPLARRLAEQRELDQLTYQHYMGASFEAGEAKGRAEGEARGRVRCLCEVFNIELDGAKERALA